uniref:Uncharacterized protein n=1 Tax=Oryza brachyantha TaxID=4533 RepID=J3NCP9_ORYBR
MRILEAGCYTLNPPEPQQRARKEVQEASRSGIHLHRIRWRALSSGELSTGEDQKEEEPTSYPAPTGSSHRACDAQRPNHETNVGAIRLYTKQVMKSTIGHETPMKAIDYLKNMARAKTDRCKAPDQQLACNSGYRFYTQSEQLIGLFYASAYFEDSEDGSEEQVRWPIEALEYSITISQFASVLGLDAVDLSKVDLHNQILRTQETIRRLYVDDSSKLTLGIVKLPSSSLRGECVHPPYRPQIPQALKISSSKGKPVGSTSQLVRPASSSSYLRIKKAVSAIFSLCKKNAMKIKSNEQKINQILRDSGHNIPQESNNEEYIDPFVAYEAELAARAAGASSSCAPRDSDEDTEEDDDEDAEGHDDDDEDDDNDDDDDDDDE